MLIQFYGTAFAIRTKTNKMKIKHLLFLLAANFLIGNSFAQNSKVQIKEKELPQVTIQDMYGKKVDVSEYGKNEQPTIFVFWATWCAPCKKELANMADLYDDWKDEFDVEIVAVSIDDARNASKVKSYVNGKAWDFEMLLDMNSDLKRALNFQTVPYLILVNKEGKIVYSHAGYVAGDEYVLEEVMEEKL